jgi:hypothetical protein
VIGGELYSDAMGAEGTYEGTYVGMIDHNATVIAAALGGEAPDRGMQGLAELMAEPTIDTAYHHRRPDRVRCTGSRRAATPRWRSAA